MTFNNYPITHKKITARQITCIQAVKGRPNDQNSGSIKNNNINKLNDPGKIRTTYKIKYTNRNSVQI